MTLFAERGYRATTVGDIEQAAGLVPRRGGLYRHFASKEEVFRAAVFRYAEKFGPLEDLIEQLDFDDEPGTLAALAQFTLDGLVEEANLFRLMQRDGHDFPELAEHVHVQLIQRGYGFAIELFRRLLTGRGLTVDDAPELAAIALGALVHFREDESIYGRTPAGVAEAPFVRVWVDTWLQVLSARTASGPHATRSAAAHTC
jgi:AcrR family transcriptional regulator